MLRKLTTISYETKESKSREFTTRLQFFPQPKTPPAPQLMNSYHITTDLSKLIVNRPIKIHQPDKNYKKKERKSKNKDLAFATKYEIKKKIPQLRKGFFRSALPPWMEKKKNRFSCSYKPNDSIPETVDRRQGKRKGRNTNSLVRLELTTHWLRGFEQRRRSNNGSPIRICHVTLLVCLLQLTDNGPC